MEAYSTFVVLFMLKQHLNGCRLISIGLDFAITFPLKISSVNVTKVLGHKNILRRVTIYMELLF